MWRCRSREVKETTCSSAPGGRRFDDVSGISGLDSLADSRSFAIFDYDRDGWSDIALINTNAPLLNLFHNEIGNLTPGPDRGRGVGLRFVGGNQSANPSERFSNRDGYGAQVTLELGDSQLMREHRAGDGFSTQNSSTLWVGIGPRDTVESIAVRWPSGVSQEVKGVAAGTLVTVYENPADAPERVAFAQEPYLSGVAISPGLGAGESKGERLGLSPKANFSAEEATEEPAFRMYITTATWCAACKASLPQLRSVRDAFPSEILGMYGVPVDPEDSFAKLAAYVKNYKPAYEILTHLKEGEVGAVLDLVIASLDSEVLPSSIVTDAEGRVLYTDAGVPTVSQLKKLTRAEPLP